MVFRVVHSTLLGNYACTNTCSPSGYFDYNRANSTPPNPNHSSFAAVQTDTCNSLLLSNDYCSESVGVKMIFVSRIWPLTNSRHRIVPSYRLWTTIEFPFENFIIISTFQAQHLFRSIPKCTNSLIWKGTRIIWQSTAQNIHFLHCRQQRQRNVLWTSHELMLSISLCNLFDYAIVQRGLNVVGLLNK